MLARYLRTTDRVRYAALDPAHEAAIRNYLALTTRAYDVPGLYQQARPHLPQGRDGELLHRLMQTMLAEHDPHALATFLDAHQDMTGEPSNPIDFGAIMHEPEHSREMLPRTLAALHAVLGGSHHLLGVPNAVQRFTPERLNDPDMREYLQDHFQSSQHQTFGFSPNIRRAGDALHSTHPSATAELDQLHGGLWEGDPHSGVGLHDLLRHLANQPSTRNIRGLLNDTRKQATEHLRFRVLPGVLNQ